MHTGMNSVFVTGTDTDVGKTYVAASILRRLRQAGHNPGFMKPYSAGPGQISQDARILAAAADIPLRADLNPAHQSAAAPPYGHTTVPPSRIIDAYPSISSRYDIMVVEGMGGAMVPITKNYFMVDLARDLKLPAVIVAHNGVGSINHIVMTVHACQARRVRITGIVLNMIREGYEHSMMQQHIRDVLDVPVLGVVCRNGNGESTLDIDSVLNGQSGGA